MKVTGAKRNVADLPSDITKSKIIRITCVGNSADKIATNVVSNRENQKRIFTEQLAYKQTLTSRKMFYYPDEAVINIVHKTASVLHDVLIDLSPSQFEELTQRITSNGGVLPNGNPSDVLLTLSNLSRNSEEYRGLKGAKERIIFMSLLGDIGTILIALNKSTPELKEALIDGFKKRKLHPPSDETTEKLRCKGNSYAVAPNKKNERSQPNLSLGEELIPISGIYNLGGKADEQMNVPLECRIQSTFWQPFKISESRTSNTTEPWVSHMSGAVMEIITVLDILRGKLEHDLYNIQSVYNAKISPEMAKENSACLALTCGFLNALGYHSALEVFEGAINYTGQSIRNGEILDDGSTDAAPVVGNGAATELLTELYEHHTKN